MSSWRAWVRRTAIVIYAVAIPVCLMAAIGATNAAGAPGQPRVFILFPIACAALAGLLAWRLWLNLRADGLARAGLIRLLLFYLPLGVLAVCGSVLIVAAIGYAILGVWVVTSGVADYPYGDYPAVERAMGSALVIGISLVASLIGAAMIWPFVRLVRRNRALTPP